MSCEGKSFVSSQGFGVEFLICSSMIEPVYQKLMSLDYPPTTCRLYEAEYWIISYSLHVRRFEDD